MNTTPMLPMKSVAIALLFCVVLGPVGLLYSSFWGGLIMLFVFLIVVSNKFIFPIILTWILCSIWGVRAVELYNRKMLRLAQEKSST